jgi:hypothetical protein
MARKYKARTLNEVRESAEYAAANDRCITVSAKWMLEILGGMEVLAMLASDKPEFFNPLHVAAGKNFRDYVLRQREERKAGLSGVKQV